MPSDTAPGPDEPVLGRCYCGASLVSARDRPQTVAYCHCSDCKRWTGAPLPAFAAFADDVISVPDGAAYLQTGAVQRWRCAACGSPLAARFDYLPGQTYVPLGILDTAADHLPQLHCHADAALDWLHLADRLPRQHGSARAALTAARN